MMFSMCEGEQRKLVIPPSLDYGDRGAGNNIPDGATLVFDVELIKIEQGNNDPSLKLLFEHFN